MTYKYTQLAFPKCLLYALTAFALDVERMVPALTEFEI